MHETLILLKKLWQISIGITAILGVIFFYIFMFKVLILENSNI